MAEACRALRLPVVGGNVSLYNESPGPRHRPHAGRGRGRADRPPRPPPARRRPRRRRPASCCSATRRRRAGLAGSRWAWQAARPPRRPAAGPRPRRATRRVRRSCASLVADGLLAGVHDVADGGLGLALAEMAVVSGVGFSVDRRRAATPRLFSEAPSRVVAVRGARATSTGSTARPDGRRRRHPPGTGRAATGSTVEGLRRRRDLAARPTDGVAPGRLPVRAAAELWGRSTSVELTPTLRVARRRSPLPPAVARRRRPEGGVRRLRRSTAPASRWPT